MHVARSLLPVLGSSVRLPSGVRCLFLKAVCGTMNASDLRYIRWDALHTGNFEDGSSLNRCSQTFRELLEASPLMKMGRPNGKAVVGIVTNICNDDLYVDFGAKFEAVVKKSSKDSRLACLVFCNV